jgi:hypothetical protein
VVVTKYGTLFAALFVAFFVMLLALPFTVAFLLTDFSVEANGAAIKAYNPRAAQVVDLAFTVDASQGFAFFPDLRSLGGTEDPSLRVDLSTCAPNATGKVRCLLPSIRFQPVNTTVRIPYRLFIDGDEYEGNVTKTFTLDSSAPNVTGIKTAVCRDTRCFIGSGVPMDVTVALKDPDGSFARGLIFFELANTAFAANNCTGTTCKGTALVKCADEQPLDLKVVAANGIASQDDAGNPVEDLGLVQRVICDGLAPKLLNVTVNGTGKLGIPAEDGSLVVHAFVQEGVTKATLIAKTKNVQRNVSENATEKADCVRLENDLQECTLTIGKLGNGKNLALPLIIRDEVGHETSASVTLPFILKVANATAAPDFFRARATQVTPAVINRAALQLALDNGIDFPQFISYELTQTATGSRVLAQEVRATTCRIAVARSGAGFDADLNANWTATPALYLDPIRVFSPNADWNVKNRLDASFLKMDTALLKQDYLQVRCNLSLTVEKDNVLYKLAEQEELVWPVQLRSSKLGTPGKAFLEKLNREQASINGGLGKMIGVANQMTATFAHFCQMQDLLTRIQASGSKVEILGLFVPGMAGQAIGRTGNGIWGPVTTMSLSYWMGKSGALDKATGTEKAMTEQMKKDAANREGTIRKFCSAIHCDIANKTAEAAASANKGGMNYLLTADGSWYEKSLGKVKPLGAAYQKLDSSAATKSYFSDLTTPSVQDSLLMSVATRCWTGVVYNLNKYRQIDCGYVQCLKEQALDGASIAPCESARGVKKCRFIMGEVFELPYARVVKNLAANVNQIVQAPLGLVWNQLNADVCKNKDTDITAPGVACHIMKTFSIQKDFQAVTKYNQLFSFPYQADLCQQALCNASDSKSCGRTTNSFLEQLLPGQGYLGDQYRVQWNAERDKQAKIQEAEAMINAMPPPGTKYVDATNQGMTKLFDQYMASQGVDVKSTTGKESAEKLWNELNNDEVVAGDTVTWGQANRNQMRSYLKQGKPVMRADQLATSLTKGEVVSTLLSSDPKTNDKIANTLFQVSSLALSPNAASFSPSSEQCSITFTDPQIICDIPAIGPEPPKDCRTIQPQMQRVCTAAPSTLKLSICSGQKLTPQDCTKTEEQLTKTLDELKAQGYNFCQKDGVNGICPCLKGSKCESVDLTGFKNTDAVADAQKTAKKQGSNQMTQNFYGWVDQLSNMMYQYLRENGKIDFLFTRGWGDWGAKVSATASDYLDPEEWKNNLCNPDGVFADVTQEDSSVYEYQSGAYRPVLTFAGEKLPFETRAQNPASPVQNLYTISFVAVSAYDDNEVRVYVDNREVTTEPIALPKGQVVSKSFSLNDSRAFDNVRLVFDRPFPQAGSEREYERPLERNAYDRGGITNATLPDIGKDDPWATTWAQPQTSSTGTAKSGTSGLGGLLG